MEPIPRTLQGTVGKYVGLQLEWQIGNRRISTVIYRV